VCQRDFVEEMESGERYAANVGTFGFERLSNEVSDRWLRIPCHSYPPVDNPEDRQQILPDIDFGPQKPQSVNKSTR
jgi:hypothetical protein